jgi:hypothetical protein
MRIIKSVVQLSIGTAFGIGMVLSCTNDLPNRSDAATCDCPSSEAPIAGRLVVVESEHDTLAPGERGGPGVMCPLGTQFLSGTCTAVDPTVLEDITLQQFGFNKTSFSWSCAFKNNKLAAVQVKASVLCLKPAT